MWLLLRCKSLCRKQRFMLQFRDVAMEMTEIVFVLLLHNDVPSALSQVNDTIVPMLPCFYFIHSCHSPSMEPHSEEERQTLSIHRNMSNTAVRKCRKTNAVTACMMSFREHLKWLCQLQNRNNNFRVSVKSLTTFQLDFTLDTFDHNQHEIIDSLITVEHWRMSLVSWAEMQAHQHH